MQAIVKMALEPEWEAKLAVDSYGFRPGRSCHDAIETVHQAILEIEKRGYAPHVLEADIPSCFDRIAHDPLLTRLYLFRDVVRRWLKAGVVELGRYEPAEQGTPQGGVISPLLANIALGGIEELFAGKWWARVVRYADLAPLDGRRAKVLHVVELVPPPDDPCGTAGDTFRWADFCIRYHLIAGVRGGRG